MEKEFKTIEGQINILKSKNLNIKNLKEAKRLLMNNNYYYLINGYKELFLNKNTKTEEFMKGIRFKGNLRFI